MVVGELGRQSVEPEKSIYKVVSYFDRQSYLRLKQVAQEDYRSVSATVTLAVDQLLAREANG